MSSSCRMCWIRRKMLIYNLLRQIRICCWGLIGKIISMKK